MLIKVVKYNPGWPEEFRIEYIKLKSILGEIAYSIHHIGSTAVPGLMAKPIIDMMPAVTSLELLDTKSGEMEALGYEVMGELGISGRRYFRKGGDDRTHQIHAFKIGDSHLVRHLAFRDYLIAHQEVALEYGKLKRDIAERCKNDIEQYCDEKDPYIQKHEAIALDWYRSQIK